MRGQWGRASNDELLESCGVWAQVLHLLALASELVKWGSFTGLLRWLWNVFEMLECGVGTYRVLDVIAMAVPSGIPSFLHSAFDAHTRPFWGSRHWGCCQGSLSDHHFKTSFKWSHHYEIAHCSRHSARHLHRAIFRKYDTAVFLIGTLRHRR
jgi:hypothetical protein